jgi:hypothetical protein
MNQFRLLIYLCMEAMLGISLCIAILILTSKNAMSYYAYVFSSTKLGTRAEQVLPGSEGEWRRRRGQGAGGRNGPNNVCTYE